MSLQMKKLKRKAMRQQHLFLHPFKVNLFSVKRANLLNPLHHRPYLQTSL